MDPNHDNGKLTFKAKVQIALEVPLRFIRRHAFSFMVGVGSGGGLLLVQTHQPSSQLVGPAEALQSEAEHIDGLCEGFKRNDPPRASLYMVSAVTLSSQQRSQAEAFRKTVLRHTQTGCLRTMYLYAAGNYSKERNAVAYEDAGATVRTLRPGSHVANNFFVLTSATEFHTLIFSQLGGGDTTVAIIREAQSALARFASLW